MLCSSVEMSVLSSYQLGVTHRHHYTAQTCTVENFLAVHLIVTGANEIFILSSPGVQVHGGQRVGMVGSGRMALMEAPAHTYSLLR